MAISLVLCSGAVAAPSRAQIAEHKRETAVLLSLAARNAPRAAADPASALPFQRGDVFALTSSGVQEYTPTGQLVQTIPASGADVLCFDPSGQHLIVPGAGLFDSSGHLLPSNWAAVNLGGPGEDGGRPECVADGRGDVYGISGAGVLTKYDLQGNVLQTFPLAQVDYIQVSIDLAPDECTMYYSAWAAPPTFTGPFNVCTNTLENSDFYPWGFQTVDDFRVLPNWGFVVLSDYGGSVFGTSEPVVGYGVPDSGGSFRHLALDSDGTSFWACCAADFDTNPYPHDVFNVYRFDLSTGQLLTAWPLDAVSIGVYSPPLLGNANVTGTVDSNTSGTAEAFRTRVRYSGQLSRLHLWVDSSSTASEAVVGIYDDHHGHPGSLQTRGIITNLRPGSWNYVDVPSIPVDKGQRYWIAMLAPSGGGTLYIRDTTGGGPSQTTGPHKLTTLPAYWPHGKHSASAAVSAYGS